MYTQSLLVLYVQYRIQKLKVSYNKHCLQVQFIHNYIKSMIIGMTKSRKKFPVLDFSGSNLCITTITQIVCDNLVQVTRQVNSVGIQSFLEKVFSRNKANFTPEGARVVVQSGMKKHVHTIGKLNCENVWQCPFPNSV